MAKEARGKGKEEKEMREGKDKQDGGRGWESKNTYFALAILVLIVVGGFFLIKNYTENGVSGGTTKLTGSSVGQQQAERQETIPADIVITSVSWSEDDTTANILCKATDGQQENCGLLGEVKCRALCKESGFETAEVISSSCDFVCEKESVSGTAVCKCSK